MKYVINNVWVQAWDLVFTETSGVTYSSVRENVREKVRLPVGLLTDTISVVLHNGLLLALK